MAADHLKALADAAAGAQLGETQVARCLEASTDAAAVRDIAVGDEARYARLLRSLVDTLNAEASVKRKTSALLCMANFAKQRAARSALFNAVKQVDVQFEKNLSEKEQAHEQFGSALGKLHETMLLLLMRIDSYKLRGAEVLEFASGNVRLCVELMLGMLKVPTYEPDIAANCCRVLCELSHPGCHVTAGDGAEVAEHTFAEFQNCIEVLTTCVMRHNVLPQAAEAVARPLKRWLEGDGGVSAAVHTAVQSVVRMILNVYSFSARGSFCVAFRQSVLVSTNLCRSIVPMYMVCCVQQVEKCVDVQEGRLVHPAPAAATAGLAAALRAVAFSSFQMGGYAVPLRELNTWTACLTRLPLQDFILTHLPLYALVLHANVNLDSLSGEHHLPADVQERMDPACRSAAILKSISQLCAALPGGSLRKLWAAVGRGAGQMPLARDSLSFDILSNVVDAALRTEREDKPLVASIVDVDDRALDAVVSDLDKHISGLEAERSCLTALREELRSAAKQRELPAEMRLLGELPPLAAAPAPAEAPSSPQPAVISPLQGMRRPSMPDLAAKLWDAADGAAASVPAEFRCALNGHLLKQPMRAPNGNVYEKNTIETWLKQSGSIDPLSGAPLTRDQLVADEELLVRVVEWQIQQTVADEEDVYSF